MVGGSQPHARSLLAQCVGTMPRAFKATPDHPIFTRRPCDSHKIRRIDQDLTLESALPVIVLGGPWERLRRRDMPGPSFLLPPRPRERSDRPGHARRYLHKRKGRARRLFQVSTCNGGVPALIAPSEPRIFDSKPRGLWLSLAYSLERRRRRRRGRFFMRRCLIPIGLLAVAPSFAAGAETLASQSFVCNNKATWERIASVKDSNDAQAAVSFMDQQAARGECGWLPAGTAVRVEQGSWGWICIAPTGSVAPCRWTFGSALQ